MRARSGTRPVCGSACSQKYRNERCCRSSRNDCAATGPQIRSSHEKAQKAQKSFLLSFVCLCAWSRMLGGYLKCGCFDVDGVCTNHHLKFARLDHITHLTIPEPELLRSKHK